MAGDANINVATIGRQNSYLSKKVGAEIKSKFGVDVSKEEHFDSVVNLIKADQKVDAIDYSDYEGASIVHDLNEPLKPEHKNIFDVVIDGGTIEHIFDAKTALYNYMSLLKVGGTLYISTPANNQMGHGFYQFSPEVFFNLFSEKYGFRCDDVILEVNPFMGGELADGKTYRVKNPKQLGERIMLANKRPVVIIIKATKLQDVDLDSVSKPIQSDYAARYDEAEGANVREAAKMKSRVKGFILSLIHI